MHILGFATCDTCHKSYFGKFNVDVMGRVTCEDCEHPTKLSKKLKFTVANSAKDISDKYLNFFFQDITILYNSYAKGKDDPSEEFYNGVDIDSRKLFYMGNDLDFAEEAHDVVFKLLKYLDTQPNVKAEDAEFIESIIERYMDLRRYKFSKTKMDNFRRDVNSKRTKAILNKLEY